MESLVSAGLHITVGHLKPLLVFRSNWHLFPSAVRLLGSMLWPLLEVLLFRGGLQLQTLQRQLLDPVGQTAGTVFNLRPEVIAPERILAHSILQSLKPEVERRKASFTVRNVVALQVAGKETGDGDESDGGFGMHHMQDNAGGASFCQVPIMFLTQDAMQPCICTPGFTPESAFWFRSPLAGQDTGRDARGLSMEEEQGDEEGVDDIAVEAEGLLVFVGAGMAMEGAEAWSIHSQFLTSQVFPHRGKSMVVCQILQMLSGDVKRRNSSSGRHGETLQICEYNDCSST